MEIVGSVPLTANIKPEARKILDRVACGVVYNEGDRLPIGRILREIIFWFEDHNAWSEIEKTILADRAREDHNRRVRDRERKRKVRNCTPPHRQSTRERTEKPVRL
jgi:hypothetical protein